MEEVIKRCLAFSPYFLISVTNSPKKLQYRLITDDKEISHKNSHTAATSGKVHQLDYNARCDKASEGNQLLWPLITQNIA